jgi:hypothetical protein
MKPAEVYYLLMTLVERSEAIFKSEEQTSHLRWHFTFEKPGYFKTLSTFVKSYLNLTMLGQRSILKHMQQINFDFFKLVDLSFRTLLGHFVSLPIALDVLMSFLVQGIKMVFRYTYAIVKLNKAFIKSIGDSKSLIEILRAETKLNTNNYKLHKYAYKFNIKPHHYDFKSAQIEELKEKELGSGHDAIPDYVPNGCQTSKIVTYEQFARIWSFLPEQYRIRNPELTYRASNDGFNLQNLYNICVDYKYDYRFCLLLIQTRKDQILGAFIDDVFRVHIRGFLGSMDSFVFSVQPHLKVFRDAGVNTKYFLGEMSYF